LNRHVALALAAVLLGAYAYEFSIGVALVSVAIVANAVFGIAGALYTMGRDLPSATTRRDADAILRASALRAVMPVLPVAVLLAENRVAWSERSYLVRHVDALEAAIGGDADRLATYSEVLDHGTHTALRIDSGGPKDDSTWIVHERGGRSPASCGRCRLSEVRHVRGPWYWAAGAE
jgi:hypothetical protein